MCRRTTIMCSEQMRLCQKRVCLRHVADPEPPPPRLQFVRPDRRRVHEIIASVECVVFDKKKKKNLNFVRVFRPRVSRARTKYVYGWLTVSNRWSFWKRGTCLFFFCFVYRNVGLYGVPPFPLPLLVLVVRKYNFVIYLTLVCRTFGWKEPARERSAQRGRQTTAFRNAQLHRA